MYIKYNINIDNKAVEVNVRRLINQTYKLLPIREEGGDWVAPLATVIEEVAGISRLCVEHQPLLFKLLSKLEGLCTLQNEKDFDLYRSIIFECLNLLGEFAKVCQV